jgi:hypothetical protein
MLEAEEAARAALAAHLGIITTSTPQASPQTAAARAAAAGGPISPAGSSSGIGSDSKAEITVGGRVGGAITTAAAAAAGGGGGGKIVPGAYPAPQQQQQLQQQGSWRFISPFQAAARAEAGASEYDSTGDHGGDGGNEQGGVKDGPHVEGLKDAADTAAAGVRFKAPIGFVVGDHAATAAAAPAAAAASAGPVGGEVVPATGRWGGAAGSFGSPFAMVQQQEEELSGG